ncbi:MAG: YczE/YyaS/YitT family protein [Pseudonocardiaceae bacterium]
MTPVPSPTRPSRVGRRLVQLAAGLVLYGSSVALLIRSRLGNVPWDVLHQGLARHLHHSIGTVSIAVGAIVLLLWIPLREKPGFGTVSNVVVIGISVDAALALLPGTDSLPVRALLAGAGIALNAVATAAYIGARLGAGPRDGLMTGLVRRTGGSVRRVRTVIEVAVVATGWALGGTLGIATVLYAMAIGPLVQILLRRLTVGSSSRTTDPPGRTGTTQESRSRRPPPVRYCRRKPRTET